MGGPPKTDLHKLEAYRLALELYRQIIRILSLFPKGESDLKGQMRRAARRVPMNIGEGVGKRGRARIASYEIALGEDKELLGALNIVEIDELAPLDEIHRGQELADREAAILTRIIQSEETRVESHGRLRS